MKRPQQIIIGLAAILCVVGAGALAYAWHPAINPIDTPKPASFDAALVKKGAQLAALGDCNTCHTAPNGKVFAGGLGLPTPFGTIYSSNITPDPETGIGRWSEAAFQRAMRSGVDREGRNLYPAFPYDHFTNVSDEDNKALYAYLMTRQPVTATRPENDLPFPINIRLVLAGWKLLFLKEGPYRPDPAHDEAWNRGAYLVDGLGHCGACHTPRNSLGAEKGDAFFAGGDAEGWHAFTINAASQSPVPWTQDALYSYFKNGYHGLHGVARGPMASVVDNMATAVSDNDLKSMALYVASVMGKPEAEREKQGEQLAATVKTTGTGTRPQSGGTQTLAPAAGLADKDEGAVIYAAACASCHESGRPVPYGGIGLQLSTAVNAETPRNLINVVLNGLPAADGAKGPVMPGFAVAMDDSQIAALASYLRGHFTTKPAWTDLQPAVQAARKEAIPAGASSAPAAKQ